MGVLLAAGLAPLVLTVDESTATAQSLAAATVTEQSATPGVCPGHEAPPGPPAVEEGTEPVAPLPVPPTPVGGPLLGSCDQVLPQGAGAPPELTASSWIVADLDSGEVLAAQDPHGRYRPASTMKILTTLVARERLDPASEVIGDSTDVEVDGSRVGIGPGGRYTVRQLLEGLLLNSGNDAAQALARTLGGTEATLTAMTETAQRYGALDTRPATTSGLDGPGMSASAYDLGVLFRIALRDPLTAEILGTRSVPFPGYGDQPDFVVSNDDPLLASYPGALAGKTGFTDAARHTFLGAAERDGRRLLVALMHGEQQPDRMWRQAAALLDYGFALPADTAPVGVLVEARPADPNTTEGHSATAAVRPSGAPVPMFTPLGLGLALAALAGALLVAAWRVPRILRKRRAAAASRSAARLTVPSAPPRREDDPEATIELAPLVELNKPPRPAGNPGSNGVGVSGGGR